MKNGKRVNGLILITVVAISCLLGVQMCLAETYPERPITLVCGYNPGGPASSIATMAAKCVSGLLKKPMVVEHRTGAGATIGATFVSKAKPDGYTLFIGSDSNMVVAPLVNPNVHYTLESFVPITGIASIPTAINVLPNRWKNLGELVADAKKHPNKITYSTQGANSYSHLGMVMLCEKADIKLKMVPMQGVAKTTTALLGGHIDIGAAQMGHMYEAGKVDILAMAEPKRLPNFPQIPTLTELGYPIVANGNFYILAPKGTPQPIVDKLNTAFVQAFKKERDSFEQILNKFQMLPAVLPPPQVEEQNRKRRDQFREVLKKMNNLVEGR